jgi:hypothetical protein
VVEREEKRCRRVLHTFFPQCVDVITFPCYASVRCDNMVRDGLHESDMWICFFDFLTLCREN